MSYNPNGPRNSGMMNTGTTGTTGTTGLGMNRTEIETPRTIPVEGLGAETPESLRDRAQHLATTVKDKATALGSQVSDRVNSGVTSVGEKMSDMANVLRDRAPDQIAPYADRAARSLERAGHYLQEQSMSDFVDDLSGIIQRHPIPSMLTGITLGFLLARNSRR